MAGFILYLRFAELPWFLICKYELQHSNIRHVRSSDDVVPDPITAIYGYIRPYNIFIRPVFFNHNFKMLIKFILCKKICKVWCYLHLISLNFNLNYKECKNNINKSCHLSLESKSYIRNGINSKTIVRFFVVDYDNFHKNIDS